MFRHRQFIMPAIFLLAQIFCPHGSVVAQSAQPKTVVDYYLMLPDKYTIEVSKERRQHLVRDDSGRVVAKDIKNGYLYISGDAGESGMVMTLFKRPDGSYLIGVNPFDEMADDLYFLSYDKGKWSNVTRLVIPKYSRKLSYSLPQHGTTVEVSNQAGKKLYDLVWAHGKFTIRHH
jgi:hypothetical protein